MGVADGEAKVNRDAFRAGGGSNGDFDRYDLNQDGLLDRGELEARAAAQQRAAEEAGVMGASGRQFHVCWPVHLAALYSCWQLGV